MNAQIQATVSSELSALPGVNVLIEGPTGTGKTYSIGTLVDYSPNLEVFFLALESGMESLLGFWTDRGKPIPPNLHWNALGQPEGGFAALAAISEKIGSQVQDTLYKMQDFERHKRNHFHKMLSILSNFKDQRTGKDFGPVDSWGPNRAIVIDGLTGMGNFALGMVLGNKPVKSQADWGIAQDQVEKVLRILCDGSKCHFVLISHVEREVDQVMGGVKVTVQSLGRALPPKIPPMFSDVILSVRTGTSWTWSTANALCDLKTRNLPVAENIPPDFKQILEKWQSRGGRLTAQVQS
jgi:hypothetical protein